MTDKTKTGVLSTPEQPTPEGRSENSDVMDVRTTVQSLIPTSPETRNNEATASSQIIRSDDFKLLPIDYRKKAVQLVSEAVVVYPLLEKDYLECADFFLTDAELSLVAVETLANKSKPILFKVLANHPQFKRALFNPEDGRVSESVKNAAFAMIEPDKESGRYYSPQIAHHPFEFVLKNPDLSWSNAFLMWVAMKLPHHILANVNRNEWPQDEVNNIKKACVDTAIKTLGQDQKNKLTPDVLTFICLTYNEPWAEKAMRLAAVQASGFVLMVSGRLKSLPWGPDVIEIAKRNEEQNKSA
jgi:hypothetical protein